MYTEIRFLWCIDHFLFLSIKNYCFNLTTTAMSEQTQQEATVYVTKILNI